jgi:hypothetical protein
MENNDKKDDAEFSSPGKDLIEYDKKPEWEHQYRDEYALKQEKNSFWELVVKTTLIVAFFPWSLLFCVWVLGMDETIYLYKEIIKDLAVLVVALILGLVGFCAIIFLIIFLFI